MRLLRQLLEAKRPAVKPAKRPAVKPAGKPSGSAWEGQKAESGLKRNNLDPKKWPMLKKAWDAYGFEVPFEKLDGIKVRSPDGCYCVVRWKNSDGHVEIADLARGSRDDAWEVQNDSYDEIGEADWRKLKIVPECDWFEIPGNPEFER